MPTGIPKGEERGKEIENIFQEILAENFPNLKKETDIQNRKHRGSQQTSRHNKNGKS